MILKNNIQNVFKNSLWLVQERVISMFLSLATITMVARVLGPEQFGLYSYCLSIVAIFSGLTILGWDRVVLKLLSEAEKDFKEIISAQLALRTCGAILAFCCSISLVYFSNYQQAITLQIVFLIALSSILALGTSLEVYFLSQLKSRPVATAKSINQIIFALCRISVVFFTEDLVMIASVSIFETGLFSLYVYRRFRYEADGLRFNKNTYKYSKNIVTNGWPLLVALQIEMICQKIYGVMLPAFMSPLDYGHFMFAFRLLEIGLAILFVATVSFFPNLSELKKTSNTYFNEKLSFYMEISLLIGVFSWIFVILAYEPMAYIFFGEKFIGAGKYLYILWALFFIQSLAFCRADFLILNASANVLLIGNLLSLIILLLVRFLLPDWFSLYFIEILIFSTFVTFIGSNIVSSESRNYLKIQLKTFRFYHCSNFLRRRLNEY